MIPAAAGASVDPQSALHTYAQARWADSDGALALAVAHYGEALALDPDRVEIAERAYVQALESGDKALALRSAALLDQAGLLPRDGTLLRIGEALEQRNWIAAATLADRMEEEGNFAFLGPILRSWIAVGEGGSVPLAVDAKDRFAALAQRYVDEHQALLALNAGDDYELCVTVPPQVWAALSEDVRRELTIIGEVVAGEGVTIDWGDHAENLSAGGYDHFRN